MKIFVFFIGFFFINFQTFLLRNKNERILENNMNITLKGGKVKIEMNSGNKVALKGPFQKNFELLQKTPVDQNSPFGVLGDWDRLKTPEEIQHKDEQGEIIPIDYYKNENLFNEKDVKENEDRKSFPKLAVKPSILLQIIQELKKFQELKKEKPKIEQPKIVTYEDIQQKEEADEKQKEADKKTLQIKEFRNKIQELKKRIEELSAQIPTDQIMDEIEAEQKQLQKLMKKLKNIEEEDLIENDYDWNEFIANESHTNDQLQQKIDKIIKEIQELRKQILLDEQQELAKEIIQKKKDNLELLEKLYKDLLQQKADREQKILDEQAKQKLAEEMKKIEDEIKKVEQEKKEDEINNKEQPNEEIAEKVEKQDDIKTEGNKLTEQIQKDKAIVENEEEIEKIDETEIKMNQEENHESIIQDAEEKKQQIQQELEKLRESTQNGDSKGVALKHQLNIHFNPIYYGMENILDKDYSNTKDYDLIIKNKKEQAEKGSTKLKQIITILKKIQEIFDVLYSDLPNSVEKLPEDTNSSVDEGLLILDKLIQFLDEYKIEEEKLKLSSGELISIVEQLQTTEEDVMKFHDLDTDYNIMLSQTDSSINEKIKDKKDEIKIEIKNCVEILNKMKDQIKDLDYQIGFFGEEIERVEKVVPKILSLEHQQKYSQERLEILDKVMEEMPKLLNLKVNIDGNIQKSLIDVKSIFGIRGTLKQILKEIDVEVEIDNNPEEKEELEKKEGEEEIQQGEQKRGFLRSFVLILFSLLVQIIILI